MIFELLSSSVESIKLFMLILQIVLISVPSRKIGCRVSDVKVCVKLTVTILTTFTLSVKNFVFLEQTINEGSLL